MRKIKATVIPEQQTLLSNSERHNGTEITVDLPMACTVTNNKKRMQEEKHVSPSKGNVLFEYQ